MGKVLIIDIDSTIPNLALKKVEKYHLDKGDDVLWNMPIAKDSSDLIYVSCVFTKNKEKCSGWDKFAMVGGSGYSLDTTLPPEIDAVLPRINLGFTTRGCFRNCKFCIVTRKEGNKVTIVGDLLDLWDGKSRLVTLMDNNILAKPSHFELICKQAIQYKITVDHNQGLDHRLLTPEIVELMTITPHKEYHLAFDNIAYLPTVERAINLLQTKGINRCNWYVLVGFDSTFQEDLDRLNYLRERKQNAYVQRYRRDANYIHLAEWANQHHIFHGMTWEQFLDHPRNKRYTKKP
jgi:radical SAM superfamily enzyme YgiQ (UPF0313 family)